MPDDRSGLIREQIPKLVAGVAQLSVPLVAEVGVGANWDEATQAVKGRLKRRLRRHH